MKGDNCDKVLNAILPGVEVFFRGQFDALRDNITQEFTRKSSSYFDKAAADVIKNSVLDTLSRLQKATYFKETFEPVIKDIFDPIKTPALMKRTQTDSLLRHTKLYCIEMSRMIQLSQERIIDIFNTLKSNEVIHRKLFNSFFQIKKKTLLFSNSSLLPFPHNVYLVLKFSELIC